MLPLLLACFAVMADAATTYRALSNGRHEGTPLRRFLIRVLGREGGTYGVGLAWCAVAVAVNVYSRQPVAGLVIGNVIIAAAFGWAARRNAKLFVLILLCLFLNTSQPASAAIGRATWKVGERYVVFCVADTTGDLPTSPAPPDGAACAVKADNLIYTYNDAAWASSGGGPGGDPTLAGDVDGAGSANDLDEAAVESELEGVLDLQDLQGAVTDAQVPDGITVTLAGTATALAANPADCFANQFATTIAASGALTCAALVDADIPNTITVDLAATATALAANPSACNGGDFVTDIAANGTLTCSTPAGGSGLTHPQVMARASFGGW